MAQTPNEPDRVSTVIFAVAVLALIAGIIYAVNSHSRKTSESEGESFSVDDVHHERSQLEDLEDENAQLRRELQQAKRDQEDAEDKLSHKRSCVEDADSLEAAKDCF